MTSISHPLSLFLRCTSNQERVHKHKLHSVKLNRTNNTERLSRNHDNQIRHNIPTEKHLLDPYRQGIIIHDDEENIGYRQTFVIRSNEVGPDKTATVGSILYLLQETALNHAWAAGLQDDGTSGTNRNNGTTRGMTRNNLIWVLSRMHLQVDRYPIWGEVMEIDTWVGAAGRNGMRRDWILRSKQDTDLVFARATSTWAMINEHTRRLSKMPDEVRAEISPWFIEKQAIDEENPEKIKKLDKVVHSNSDLKPQRSDLDMNHHVNNVKYVRWMLEAIPNEFLESHQLSGIVVEYRRECWISDVVQSLCGPVNENLWASNQGPKSYTHLLQRKGEHKNEEIARGKTTWKTKKITRFNYNDGPEV